MMRLAPHAGIDLGAAEGTPVIAAARGEVANVDFDPAGCGLGVLIHHERVGRYTVYCHLSRAMAKAGERVPRGRVIGHVGATGNAGDVPHLHWQLCVTPCPFGSRDGLLEGTEDPERYLAGCYHQGEHHGCERLVLTYPLACRNESVTGHARGLETTRPKKENVTGSCSVKEEGGVYASGSTPNAGDKLE